MKNGNVMHNTRKKLTAIFVFSFAGFTMLAQNDPCLERVLSTPGKWGETTRTERTAPAELAIQKKFINAVTASLEQNYSPRHLQADRSVFHAPLQGDRPVTYYGVTVYGMEYSCKGDGVVLNHETSTKMSILFNHFSDAELYETSSDEILTGFHKLSRGLPEEIRPGVWQFPDQRTSLGFGIDGNSKLWLITHDGKLPWTYVTRREFLVKRKVNLQKQMAAEEPRLKEQLEKWEMIKRSEEQRGDAQKLAAFMKSTYNPGVERDRANYHNAMEGWNAAIRRVDEQLAANPGELNKKAIVVRSEKNFRDYDLVETVVPFAEVLVKPNPDYFNRSLGRSVPQFITAEIIINPKNVIAAKFADDMQSAINLDYLKSFIGKNAPGNNPGKPVIRPAGETKNSAPSQVSTQSSAGTSPMPSKGVEVKVVANNASAGGTSPGNAAGKPAGLTGVLSAPAGAAVTVTNNGSNDIVITVPKSGQLYSSVPVSFAEPLAGGATNKIEVRKCPANMKSIVYRGGTGSENVDHIRVAVDYTYDLVTRSTDDKSFSSFYESYAPAVGGYNGEEGRYVAFISLSKNVDGSDGKYRQVFWRDRNTGITKMISRSPSGEQGNGDSYEPSMSADGQTVVFESKATNMTAGDNNNFKDVFVWKAPTNTIEMVSKAMSGGPSNAESFDAMVSGNGQYVVFTSSASNMVSTSKGRSVSNVFVRDLQAGKTEMISIDPVQETGGNGFKGSISFDGSRVSFCSASNALVSDDGNNLWDIFLWQRGKAGLKRVSLTHDKKERNGGGESASRQVASSLSGDGRFVVFATTATNMVPGDNNTFQDVFIIELESGKVSVASFARDGQPSNGDSPIDQGDRIAISFDGTWVAFPTKATNLGAPGSNVILHNTITGEKQPVSNVSGSYVGRPAISYRGGYVVFGKSANLDTRFNASGIFAHFTGVGPCRDCK